MIISIMKMPTLKIIIKIYFSTIYMSNMYLYAKFEKKIGPNIAV
jgi:hypothetical protein